AGALERRARGFEVTIVQVAALLFVGALGPRQRLGRCTPRFERAFQLPRVQRIRHRFALISGLGGLAQRAPRDPPEPGQLAQRLSQLLRQAIERTVGARVRLGGARRFVEQRLEFTLLARVPLGQRACLLAQTIIFGRRLRERWLALATTATAGPRLDTATLGTERRRRALQARRQVEQDGLRARQLRSLEQATSARQVRLRHRAEIEAQSAHFG